jgi:TPR repeat protein
MSNKAKESIEIGNVPVEYLLGVFYCKGYGTEKNDEKALHYFERMFYEKKQDKDNRKKYFALHNDKDNAFDCFMEDAQRNNKHAQYRIGLYYYFRGDNKEALDWFLIAVEIM